MGVCKISEAAYADIAARYARGEGTPQISVAYSVTVNTIIRILKILGIPRRSRIACQHTKLVNDSYFQNIDHEDKAYWLGFIAADGYVLPSKGIVAISLASRDRDHLVLFNQCVNNERQVLDYVGSTPTKSPTLMSRASIRSREMVSDLEKHNVVANKSLSCQAWVDDSSLLRHYWRGVWDGDGSLSYDQRPNRSGKDWEFMLCGSKEMMTSFSNYLSPHFKKAPSVGWSGSCYRVRKSGVACVQTVLKLLYENANFYLARKKVLVDECLAVRSRGQKD